MSPVDSSTDEPSQPAKASVPTRVRGDGASGSSRSRLIALGSAAVVAVYAAGFDRTRAAAQQFAGDDVRRHAPAQPAQPAANGISEVVGGTGATTAVRYTPPAEVSPAPTVSGSAVSPKAASHVVALVSPAQKTLSAPAADSMPAAAPAKAAAADTATSAARSTDASPEVAKATIAAWKDGSYTGWGTSRHGDIQATVVIAEGRIQSAVITQCLTRYSCSWIAALPPQVVTRQSAEVDFVSGATQSTNAFYQAVVEALSKAK
ncbi:MAG: FMN-binding protein [bacterium]